MEMVDTVNFSGFYLGIFVCGGGGSSGDGIRLGGGVEGRQTVWNFRSPETQCREQFFLNYKVHKLFFPNHHRLQY